MRDSTGRSRCFAFLTFEDPASVNAVMVREHFLDGKIVRSVYCISYNLPRLKRFIIDRPKASYPSSGASTRHKTLHRWPRWQCHFGIYARIFLSVWYSRRFNGHAGS